MGIRELFGLASGGLFFVAAIVVAVAGLRVLVGHAAGRRLGRIADTAASAAAVSVYPETLRGEVPHVLPREEDHQAGD